MAEYFRYDFKVQLALEQYKALLEPRFNHKPIIYDAVYNASLVFNQIKPEYIKFTIYYDQSDYIFEKLEFLKESDVTIPNLIKSAPAENKWQYPSILNFDEAILIDLLESHYYQHDKKPVILVIDKISIVDQGGFFRHGRFNLTENAIQHISNYITYNHTYYIDETERFVEQNTHREVRFGPIEFTLMFEHYYQSVVGREITITRDPYLVMTDPSEALTAEQLTELGNNLCLLMSFFWQKGIDFFHAKVRTNLPPNYRTKELIKYSVLQDDKSVDSKLEEKFGTFYNFIDCIDYEQFINHSAILADIVNRVIKSKKIDLISRFMVYYNIIEKIRNYCMDNPIKGNKLSIKEEYDFTVGKGKITETIKSAIKSIVSIVQEADKEGFLANASNKVTFVKKTGLIDQFESLISYLELNPQDYTIDFRSLIKIRNDIYHGKLPKENVDGYNQQMHVLIYDMLIKLITY